MIVLVGLVILPLGLWAIGWSQMKEFDPEELGMMAGTVGTVAITVMFIARIKTYLRLETDKFIFRTSPVLPRRKTIRWDEVQSWHIARHTWRNGLGYKTHFNGNRFYVLLPGKVLCITTKDGRNYRFGINRPALVKRFIVENWEQKDTVYG